MAIDLGSSNTSRYHSVPDHADFTLPNGDWAWITLCYPQSSVDIKYIISTGNFGVANSLNLIVYNNTGFSVKIDTRSEDVVTTPVALDQWHWLYATRRSGFAYCGMVPVGSSSVTETAGSAIASAYDSTTGPNIGRRSDGTANRYWKGRWGQAAFVSGAGITAAQAVELANGAPLLSMPFAPSIKALWHGRNANDASVTSLVGGHVATKQGTSYGASEEDIQTPYIWTPEYIQASSASSGSTGTVDCTNASDTSAASGTTTVTGTLATTNADDTSAASGAVGSDVTGSVAYTNLSDTSSAAGTTTVTGSSAITNASDTATASGFAGSVTGTVDYTNNGDTASASGSGGAVVAEFSGGYPHISREDHAERKKKERIKLGIIEEDARPEVKENKGLDKKKTVLVPASKPQKNLLAEQEAFNAELKHLLQLELEREEEAIIRLLMDM